MPFIKNVFYAFYAVFMHSNGLNDMDIFFIGFNLLILKCFLLSKFIF